MDLRRLGSAAAAESRGRVAAESERRRERKLPSPAASSFEAWAHKTTLLFPWTD